MIQNKKPKKKTGGEEVWQTRQVAKTEKEVRKRSMMKTEEEVW